MHTYTKDDMDTPPPIIPTDGFTHVSAPFPQPSRRNPIHLFSDFCLPVCLPTCLPVFTLPSSKDGTVYTGRFEGGRPKGEGEFAFPSGISQLGYYEALTPGEDADEEEPPALLWRGQSIVAC